MSEYTTLTFTFACLGLKNKSFVCPFGPKIRRVGRSVFFFFFFLNLDADAITFMRVHSWACRTSELKLILVLKGGCILLYLVKEPFGDSYKRILTFYLNIFVTKNQIEYQKKTKQNKTKTKKPFFFLQYFGSVGKGQTHIFLLRPYRLAPSSKAIYLCPITRFLFTTDGVKNQSRKVQLHSQLM